MRPTAAAVLVALTTACTHWGTVATPGERREVARRLLGAPRFEGHARCVQEAELDLEQSYELTAAVDDRQLDLAGGAVTGFVGLAALVGASAATETRYQPGDPPYESPPWGTPGLVIGGAMLAGGVAWIAYSYRALPKGPRPAARTVVRRWTSTELVDTIGCGDAPLAPPPPADAAARLKTLDELRAAGLITEAEYQARRAALAGPR